MSDESLGEWKLPEETKNILLKRFKELDKPVHIAVFTKKGENDEYPIIEGRFICQVSFFERSIHSWLRF